MVMSSRFDPAGPELLAEQAAWLRRLALGLAGSVQGAEDLTQETFLLALQRPPRLGRPVRGWLATVLLNAWRKSLRGERRRVEREAKAARPEAQDEADGVVARVELHRRLAQAVQELEEPYRSTLVLRYFEDLPPRRIAARLGRSPAAVKSHLARGLERLRRRLEREEGADGSTWLGALAPLLHPSAGASLSPAPIAVALKAFAVNTKLVLTLAALGLAAGAFVFWQERTPQAGERREPVPTDFAPTAAVLDRRADPAIEAALTPAQRDEVVPVVAPRRAEPVESSAGALRYEGRVLDVRGRAVADVAVALAVNGPDAAEDTAAGASPVARSSGDGRFEFESEGPTSGRLVVAEDAWATVLAGVPTQALTVGEDGGACTIVVAPRLAVAGRVIDADGVAVADAGVSLELPEDLRASLGLVLDRSIDLHFAGASDADGHFELPALPAIEGARLRATREGWLPADAPLPMHDTQALLLVLNRPIEERRQVAGEVLDPSGAPVPGARVALGFDSMRTDERGQFVFDLGAEDTFNQRAHGFFDFTPTSLVAVQEGFQAARYEAPLDADGRPSWPAHVVLRLGGTPLSIRGRVVDGQGEPFPSARVWLADPTFFGGLGDPGRQRFAEMAQVENLLVADEEAWRQVQCDAEGRFEIGGLLDRAYTLEALDPRTLQRAIIERVEAGRDGLEIALPSDAVYAKLRGTVVDGRGAPFPGVAVFPMCDAFRQQVGGVTLGTHHLTSEGVTTDSEGRFELFDVPRDLVYLRMEGPNAIPLEWGRGVQGGLFALVGRGSDDLVVTVPRRCHFQVELDRPDEADALAMLDPDGNALEISEFQGNARESGPRARLLAGRSPMLAVGDAAATLVLYRAGVEVRRTPVQLQPGEPTVLHP